MKTTPAASASTNAASKHPSPTDRIRKVPDGEQADDDANGVRGEHAGDQG